MMFGKPIRSAGVFSLIVAAAVCFTAEPSDARPRKRAPARTAKQVKPPPLPAIAPLPRPSPLRQTTIVIVDVPMPRPNPLTAMPEPAAASLRLFAPSASQPPPLRASTASVAALKEPRLPPMPAEFAARELAFTAVIGDSAVGEPPAELLSPRPLYQPVQAASATAPVPAALVPAPRQLAEVSAALPPIVAPPPPLPIPVVPAAAPPAAAVPLPPLPPIAKRPLETAAAPTVATQAAPLPPAPPPLAPLPVAPLPQLPPASETLPAPAEVAAVAPAEPVPTPDPAPPESGFDAAERAEDTVGVHEYASLADVPDVVRELAESLPECVPLDKGARRQPFGGRTLFSFACPAARPDGQERAFVLARDELGNGANVLMFPRPGGKAVEPLHELSNPRVAPEAREFIHNAVDPKDRPCRQQGRWRVDERGNAGLVAWRASNSCDGDWATAAVSEKKDPPAAKSSRGSKKSSARKSSRGKAKATARKAPPAKKKPVKKKR